MNLPQATNASKSKSAEFAKCCFAQDTSWCMRWKHSGFRLLQSHTVTLYNTPGPLSSRLPRCFVLCRPCLLLPPSLLLLLLGFLLPPGLLLLLGLLLPPSLLTPAYFPQITASTPNSQRFLPLLGLVCRLRPYSAKMGSSTQHKHCLSND